METQVLQQQLQFYLPYDKNPPNQEYTFSKSGEDLNNFSETSSITAKYLLNASFLFFAITGHNKA